MCGWSLSCARLVLLGGLRVEDEHAELGVRRLVERARPHAAVVLVCGEGGGAVLRVPQVEDAGVGGAHHAQPALHVLAVQVDVLEAPAARPVVREAADAAEVRPVLARHAVAEVAPEAGVLRDDELGRGRGVGGRVGGVAGARGGARDRRRVVEAEDDRVVDGAAGARVQPAPVEERRREDDVDVAQEQQLVGGARRPAERAELQAAAAREPPAGWQHAQPRRAVPPRRPLHQPAHACQPLPPTEVDDCQRDAAVVLHGRRDEAREELREDVDAVRQRQHQVDGLGARRLPRRRRRRPQRRERPRQRHLVVAAGTVPREVQHVLCADGGQRAVEALDEVIGGGERRRAGRPAAVQRVGGRAHHAGELALAVRERLLDDAPPKARVERVHAARREAHVRHHLVLVVQAERLGGGDGRRPRGSRTGGRPLGQPLATRHSGRHRGASQIYTHGI